MTDQPLTDHSEGLTKAQIVERDDQLRVHHPLGSWLRHHEHCPARQMRMDMLAVDGPCRCGLNAALRSTTTQPDTGLREAVGKFVAWQYRERGAARFTLTDLRAALATEPAPTLDADRLARAMAAQLNLRPMLDYDHERREWAKGVASQYARLTSDPETPR